jgi:hypothetical protein
MIPLHFGRTAAFFRYQEAQENNAIAQLLRSARGSRKHASVINQSRYVVSVKRLAAQTREFPHAKNRLKNCRID